MNRPFDRILPWISPRTAALTLAVLLLAAGNLNAADLNAADEAADQIWLISTRSVGYSPLSPESPAPLEYRRRTAEGTWLDADARTFQAADDSAVPTCIFIHGNRETSRTAVKTGMSTYRHLRAGGSQGNVRFVIWSWPADRVCRRNRDDLRLKAVRSDTEAHLLAQCLRQIDPRVPVTLIGYSFGARAITGSMHLLAGGQVAGRELDGQDAAGRRAPRAVLVAAALANHWLLPDRRNGLALGQLDTVLLTRNGRDSVLRWYSRLDGHGGPEALGYTGPACPGRLGDQQQKIELLDVSCSVGKDHSWQSYLGSPRLTAGMARYVFDTEN